MNSKKIITSIIISISLFAVLYFGCSFFIPTEELKTIILAKFNLNVCALISGGFGIVYLLSSFRYKTTPESEIPLKKFEFLYNQCDNELKKELDKLSDEDKVRYVESTIPLLTIEQNTDLDNYMFKLIRPQKSKFAQVISNLLLLSLVIFIGYTGYETYNVAKPALDSYSSSTKIEDQVLNVEGLPQIQLHSNNSFKKGFIDKIISDDIKTQPAYLLKNVSMIHLCDVNEYRKQGVSAKSLSFPSITDNSVYINVSISNAHNIMKFSITSALVYLFDMQGSNGYHSLSEEFLDLYNNNPYLFSEFAVEDSMVYFSEAGTMYVNNPEALKSRSMDLYNYFDNLFNNQ